MRYNKWPGSIKDNLPMVNNTAAKTLQSYLSIHLSQTGESQLAVNSICIILFELQ